MPPSALHTIEELTGALLARLGNYVCIEVNKRIQSRCHTVVLQDGDSAATARHVEGAELNGEHRVVAVWPIRCAPLLRDRRVRSELEKQITGSVSARTQRDQQTGTEWKGDRTCERFTVAEPSMSEKFSSRPRFTIQGFFSRALIRSPSR